MFTHQEKTEYVSKRGMICPRCKSTDIEAMDLDQGEEHVMQGVSCKACKIQWTDIYSLTDVEEVEKNTTGE